MMRARVLLLGGDRTGRVSAAFERLGAEVVVEDARPDYAVVLADATDSHIDDALDTLADAGVEVVPSPRAARLCRDREGLRRLAADELGLPTVPFWFANSVAEVAALTEHVGFPMVLKSVLAAAGERPAVLLRPEDIAPAFEKAAGAAGRVLVETVVDIDHEVTLLTVRGAAGCEFCEPIGHRQTDGSGTEVLEAWQPHRLSQTALDAARSIAARIVNALGGRGLFGVELLVRGDEVYFADVGVRPHDAALVTARSQRLSVFDLHARVALGLPTDTALVGPAAAEFLTPGVPPISALAEALQVPETDVRVDADGGVAVVLATARDVTTARDRVRQASRALRRGGDR